MISHLSPQVAREQIAGQRLAAERYHLAVATADRTRQPRSPRLSSLRANRSLLGVRKRTKLA